MPNVFDSAMFLKIGLGKGNRLLATGKFPA